MASITITNNNITTISNTVVVNYTTDVTLTKVELTKDSSSWITATTYTQTSATFNISSWGNGTYSSCKLRITYEVVNAYGQIVLNVATLNINEGSTGTFTVKLDSAPTNNQTVNLSVNNSNCTLNKSSLTFTPTNYSTAQTVTVTGAHDSNSYEDKSSVITASSPNVSNKTLNVTIKNIDSSSGGESLDITSITAGTFTTNEAATLRYTTNKAVTTHEFIMNYTGSSSGFSDGTGRVTSSGNNHTMTFNAGDLSVGTKNGAIRVTDGDGNTALKTFTLIIQEASSGEDPGPGETPSTGQALDDWDVFNNTYGNVVAYMADRVGVNGKAIRMTATQTSTTVQGTTQNYRSGALVSKKAFKYGTFTFKFKLSANDTYLWAMIWTLPDLTKDEDGYVGKNQRPEFDLLETWGSYTNNSVVQTYHTTTPSGESKTNLKQAQTHVDMTQEHTLKLEWTQDNVVKMYCDGVLKLTINEYMTNWQTGEVDYQIWFLNLGLGTYDGKAPNGVGWFEITDYEFKPVYTRDRRKLSYGVGNFSDGTLPSGPLPSSGGSGSGSGVVPATYTITKNLTNCTCSNSNTSITDGSSYSATISANSGYDLSTLTVTMGGNDITSSAVSGNSINISSVTGNIVITASATQQSSGSELTITNMNAGTFTTSNTVTISYTTSAAVTKHEFIMNYSGDSAGFTDGTARVTSSGNNHTMRFNPGDLSAGTKNGAIRVTDANGNTAIAQFTLVITDGNAALTSTILNMQYASAHEVLPNAPIDDVWKDRPRDGKGMTIPTQSCTECASGTHTATESYSAGSLWSTFGQWGTIYKIKDTELVENVGVEITDFKMWRYNTSTNQWVLVNDTFDYGAFYYETFWDDGSAPLNDHKVLSSDKKTYKCLMDSQTSGRCFHPFSTQKKWSDYGFTTNPCYVVAQMKARLIVWDENGADNRASANLCMDVGGDYWIRQGASFDDQWRHNGDMMIGYYKKITNDWRYVYMTTCPDTWDKGFPCDSIVEHSNETRHYLVTNDLFNCTSSNSVTSITAGSSYSATISANSGYKLSTITVTMGETDITSSAVSGNSINISSVTGDLEITASATATSSGVEPTEPVALEITNITGGTFSADWSIPYTTNKPVVTHYYSTWYQGSDSSTTWMDRTGNVTDNGNNSYSMAFQYNQFTPGTKSPAIKVVDADGNIAIKTFTLVIE